MNNSEKHDFLRRSLPLAAGLLAWSVAGCRAAGEIPDAVISPITSRFSQAGPTEVSGQQMTGLQVLSDSDLVQIEFAQRLQQKLSTELELTHPQLRVVRLPLRGENLHSAALPGPDPFPFEIDSPRGLPTAETETPSLDRVFQVRVIQYRPWLPMHVHLQLMILDGKTRQQLHASTAAWSVRDDQICGGCEEKPARWHRKQRCRKSSDAPNCEPSPTHNSPEALLDQIAQEVAQWYGSVLFSENPAIGQK